MTGARSDDSVVKPGTVSAEESASRSTDHGTDSTSCSPPTEGEKARVCEIGGRRSSEANVGPRGPVLNRTTTGLLARILNSSCRVRPCTPAKVRGSQARGGPGHRIRIDRMGRTRGSVAPINTAMALDPIRKAQAHRLSLSSSSQMGNWYQDDDVRSQSTEHWCVLHLEPSSHLELTSLPPMHAPTRTAAHSRPLVLPPGDQVHSSPHLDRPSAVGLLLAFSRPRNAFHRTTTPRIRLPEPVHACAYDLA
jgi:hypothetical protein